MHVFKIATLQVPGLEERFWEVVLMVVENDGRNQIQLKAVGVDVFVDNSLAMRLHWFFATNEKLTKEVPQYRWQMIGPVTPFVHLTFWTSTTNSPSSTPTSLPPNPTQPEPHMALGQSTTLQPKSTKKSPTSVTISTSQYLSPQPQPS
ncbi:hypothetical protein JAAARDRAFT_197148 [Jaapia argillacea MUCL 33604]|uniref:Uncharacterized protein n=1 Tax=Jaapia argillacea MUCL 33604 TaxID=933084 RepID=A0A067PIM4_9AGAM|nr:hypothetical protein JAAARDRAFT_197148 [Jaapia argillacea MUCL 33604]